MSGHFVFCSFKSKTLDNFNFPNTVNTQQTKNIVDFPDVKILVIFLVILYSGYRSHNILEISMFSKFFNL